MFVRILTHPLMYLALVVIAAVCLPSNLREGRYWYVVLNVLVIAWNVSLIAGLMQR